MKPILEKIEPGFGSSFAIRKFTEINSCRVPNWHFHPEYELVYVSSGMGKRHVGEHVSNYKDGDLIFLGPNLPHLSFTDELYDEHIEVVVQLREDFLGKEFLNRPEMMAIRQLFERAKQGLVIETDLKHEIGKALIDLVELENFDRLLSLLQIFNKMSRTEDYRLLNATGFGIEVNTRDEERIRTIYRYVENNFRESIPLESIAKEIHMTVPAFCRYFKKLTNKTFTNFVNEFRVAYACKLLSREHLSISQVSLESGFNNFSHFNKQFRAITGKSPSDYRKELSKMINSSAIR